MQDHHLRDDGEGLVGRLGRICALLGKTEKQIQCRNRDICDAIPAKAPSSNHVRHLRLRCVVAMVLLWVNPLALDRYCCAAHA